jgi:hypothetical protein
MTAVLLSLAFLSAAACVVVLTLAAIRLADSIDRDTQSRRPRNFTQGAVQQDADRERVWGIQSFHKLSSKSKDA